MPDIRVETDLERTCWSSPESSSQVRLTICLNYPNGQIHRDDHAVQGGAQASIVQGVSAGELPIKAEPQQKLFDEMSLWQRAHCFRVSRTARRRAAPLLQPRRP